MLVMSFVSVVFFGFFSGEMWFVFLIIGAVVIALFFASIVGSLVYLFVGKVPVKYRFIPLAANLSIFFLFPFVQQVALSSQGNGYWLRAVPESARVLSYVCEDNAHFTINFTAGDEFQISAEDKLYTFKLESNSDDKVRIFGNDEYAITFVSTYDDDQIIFTRRDPDGPLSTICHIRM
jgi:energy-coupling factor transporter transmembrane protein EcfT